MDKTKTKQTPKFFFNEMILNYSQTFECELIIIELCKI